MKLWKYAALAATGAVVVQLAGCASQLAYGLLEMVATQVISGILDGATGA